MTTPLPLRAWMLPPEVVVAAVDFEPASVRATALAGAIATASRSQFRVVHAERVDAPPYFTPEQIAALEGERRESTRELTTELQRLVAAATRRAAAVRVVEGPPVETILTQSADADLLVLGTHGRRGPSRWWLGSVAERVVRAAQLPVLVTRDDTTVPPSDVFARVALASDAHAPGDETFAAVNRLVRAMDGHVTTRLALDHCAADALADASLVVVAGIRARSHWGLPDLVTDALGHCARPVLFLPAPGGGR
ncbi:MAG: universal stress protein [Vicinamibacterales bacterium]